MALVLEAANQVQFFYLKHECECANRHTHGLPCIHEIAPFKMTNTALPLSFIHEHWKKLSLVAPNDGPDNLDILQADWNVFVSRFKNQNQEVQRHLLQKVKEFVHLECTTLVEPKKKAWVPWVPGRKQIKQEKLMCRDSSEFEYGESSLQTSKVKASVCGRKPTKQQQSTRKDPSKFQYVESAVHTPKDEEKPCHKPKVAANLFDSPYLSEFLEPIRQYIKIVKDVDNNGNCRFRTISALIGFVEHEWQNVLHYNLSYFENGPAPQDRWMTMPDMGHLIASTHNVVLVYLSKHQCLTFLPVRSPPLPSMGQKVIAIGFVNDKHFVQVFLKPFSPMPPIACNWKKYRHEQAKGWDTPYTRQIEDFHRIIRDNVATREVFDIE